MSIQIVNGSRIYVRDATIEAPVEEAVVVQEDVLLHEHEDGLAHSHEGGDLAHNHEGDLDEEVENNDVSDSSGLGGGPNVGLWNS